MVRAFYYSCAFLYTAVVSCFILTVARAVWKPRMREWGRKGIWIAAVAVIAGSATYINVIGAVLFSKVELLVNCLLLSFAIFMTYRCRYRNAFCLVFLFWSLLALADFFFMTLIYTIRDSMGLQPDIFVKVTISRGIYLLVWNIFLYGVIYYVRRLGEGRFGEAAVYLKWGWFLVVPLFVCMTYFQRIYRLLIPEWLMYRWWLFILGGLLLIFFVMAYLIGRREKERYWLLQQKAEMLEYDYKAMQKAYQEKEVLLHDAKKHLLVIREMAAAGKEQEIIRYVDEMGNVLQKDRKRDLVNHELLNLILNRKFQEAEESGISIRYKMDDMEGLMLKFIELCALFSNILDNAIEANKALEESARWIRVICNRNGRMLSVYVLNPMPKGKINFIEGIPQTTKKDKRNHGMGMRSIKQIIDSYDGYMQIEAEDDIYGLTLHLEGFR